MQEGDTAEMLQFGFRRYGDLSHGAALTGQGEVERPLRLPFLIRHTATEVLAWGREFHVGSYPLAEYLLGLCQRFHAFSEIVIIETTCYGLLSK